MTSTETMRGFVLDVGTSGAPALLPAEPITDAGGGLRIQLTHPDGDIELVPTSATLPGSDVQQLQCTEFDDGSPLWVISLVPEAPVGTWVGYFEFHVRTLHCTLGLWPVEHSVPALHVRGRNQSHNLVVISIPLQDADQLARVEELIETDQRRLLDEARTW